MKRIAYVASVLALMALAVILVHRAEDRIAGRDVSTTQRLGRQITIRLVGDQYCVWSETWGNVGSYSNLAAAKVARSNYLAQWAASVDAQNNPPGKLIE